MLRNVSPHPLAEPSGLQPYCCCPPPLPESLSISPFVYSAKCATSELVVLVHFGALPAGIQVVCACVCAWACPWCVCDCVCACVRAWVALLLPLLPPS